MRKKNDLLHSGHKLKQLLGALANTGFSWKKLNLVGDPDISTCNAML